MRTPQVNPSIFRSLKSSTVEMSQNLLKTPLQIFWECSRYWELVNISVYHPWWVEAENQLLNSSRTEFGRRLIHGVAGASLRKEEKL
jgi:hypothetical protein